MRHHVHDILVLALGTALPASVSPAGAQPPPSPASAGKAAARPGSIVSVAEASSIAAFRKGLEVSVEGSPWGPSRTIGLPSSRCVPATTSPCAPGTPALIVNIRFPTLLNAADGASVLRQLGETGPAADHYFVRPVPANTSGTVCAGGFATPSPLGNMRMAINLGSPGTPLPVTCHWTALAGVSNPRSPGGIDLIWSDTVTVQVVARP
jgi:hypothetical protein